ncbi:hypothetical protein B296_00050890 [Ensete ventricosum]|uniref:Annexin n=1 Tax=Ensete ventricosum TaxID=4639 RepID=A0A426YJC8_ENSVE|nr:hypothetical protein B296_00050890 [Ensete ventricosum]
MENVSWISFEVTKVYVACSYCWHMLAHYAMRDLRLIIIWYQNMQRICTKLVRKDWERMKIPLSAFSVDAAGHIWQLLLLFMIILMATSWRRYNLVWSVIFCINIVYTSSLSSIANLQAVKSETSGHFELALLTILRCAENPGKYFAKVHISSIPSFAKDNLLRLKLAQFRKPVKIKYLFFELGCQSTSILFQVLRKAMKGLGTNDVTLIRVVVTRSEIDMQYIKAEYHKKYKKPLRDAIHSETSGHYRTFLLALVGSGP